MQLSHCRIITFALIVALIIMTLPSPVHANSSREAIKKIYELGIIVGAVIVIAIGHAIVGQFKNIKKSLTTTPKQIDFGIQPVDTNGEQTIGLINTGKAGLIIDDISASGDCFSILHRPDADPIILSSKEEMKVVVGFTARPGKCKGTLQVSTKVEKKRYMFKFHMIVRGVE